MNLLKWMLGAFQSRRPPVVVKKSPKVARPVNVSETQPPVIVSAYASLAAAKLLGQMTFICRSYGMTVSDGKIDDLKSDLAMMIAQADLSSVRLELVGSDSKVLFEFKVEFNNAGVTGRPVDSAQGVEVPLLDRQLVKERRLIVHRNGHEARYRHALKLNWGTAAMLQKTVGSTYASEHAVSITAGRQQAQFHVSDAARHRLVVTETSKRKQGYLFAKDLDIDRDVFVLGKHLPPDFEPQFGKRFTALIIATPRGLQARAIQAA